MTDFQPEDVYFEREFESHDADGNIKQVKLMIYKPEQIDMNQWRCSFQIFGIGQRYGRRAD